MAMSRTLGLVLFLSWESDVGFGSATKGLIEVKVIRPVGKPPPGIIRCDTGIIFAVVLHGSVTVRGHQRKREQLVAGDAFWISAGLKIELSDSSEKLEILQVVAAQTA